MFAKFSISIDNIQHFIDCFDWRNISSDDINLDFQEQLDNSRKILDANLLKDNIWDGDAIRESNFPTHVGDFDIFISHSHNDVAIVKQFAYLMHKQFGIRCFIDSSIWRNMEDLLKAIDKDYCKIESNPPYYDYNKRNYSTAHVHTMLSMALMEMIDNCDCFLFVGSNQSMLNLPYFKGHSDATLSPWIFEENKMVNLVKPNIPDWALKKCTIWCSADGSLKESEMLQIVYKLNLYGFHKLSCDLLYSMWKKRSGNNNFLDELCSVTGVYDELNNLLYD